MLASSTALVLSLALGVAPAPPVVPAPSAPAQDAATTEAPAEAAPSPEAPADDAPEAPSDPSTTEVTPTDAEPTTAPPGDATSPSGDEGEGEAEAEDDDPFGDQADEDPWPDEPDAEADDAPLPDYDPLRDSPQALRARHWVRTGIGTMAAGGALLVGAIIIGASDPCNRAAGNSCQPAARNRAALVMGVPAAILIGGGATMLGIGLERRRRLAIDLQASRVGAGVIVRGRF